MPASRKRALTPPLVDFELTDELEPGEAPELRAHEETELRRFDRVDLSDVDLTGVILSQCVLESPVLTGAEFRAARFVEVVMNAPFATVMKATRTSWRNARIINPRWGSAELYDSELDSIHIRGGKIDYLNLSASKLTNVIIEDCLITELDLGGVRASRVAVRGCRIETLDLGGAILEATDLRTTDIARVNGLAGLRGATIDDLQLSLFAPQLAEHLGIIVD